VSNRKVWVRVLVARDPAAGSEPSDHGTQYLASRGVVFFQHLTHHGFRLRSQQLPAAAPGHCHLRPSIAEQQNNRLGLRMDIVIPLPPGIDAPGIFLQRHHLVSQQLTIDLSQRDGWLVRYHDANISQLSEVVTSFE